MNRAKFRQKLINKSQRSIININLFTYFKYGSVFVILLFITRNISGSRDFDDLLLLVEDVDIGSRVLPGRTAEDLKD